MNCPNCLGKVTVEETIKQERKVWRQRKCLDCGFKFYTKEEVCADSEAAPLFREWVRERSRKATAKKKGLEYEVSFADGREKPTVPKRPTSPLF